jgi:hypothetical protein
MSADDAHCRPASPKRRSRKRRSRAPFQQRDVTRAVKAVAKAGVGVGGVEIHRDKIIVFAAASDGCNAARESNEWDEDE